MFQTVKQSVKAMLVKKQHERYQKEFMEKKVTYNGWIRQKEKDLIPADPDKQPLIEELTIECTCVIKRVTDPAADGRYATFLLIPFGDDIIQRWEQFQSLPVDYIFFCRPGGQVADHAYQLVDQLFRESPTMVLAYGDEDLVPKIYDRRKEPWFKPDWSPDTFLSQFYLGSLIAIRKITLDTMAENEEFAFRRQQDYHHFLYWLCYEAARLSGGFQKRNEQSLFHFPVGHIDEVLYHGTEPFDRQSWQLPKDLITGDIKNPLLENTVSVIIPSKDNAAVLMTCLKSVCSRTDTVSADGIWQIRYEIILIDNGSSRENQAVIREQVDQLNQTYGGGESHFLGIHYYYEPQEFHFSRMCNSGAGKAQGNFLLFLNDDIEVTESKWMLALARMAGRSYVGAAGIKLLYPDSDTIQHAGVSNLRMGPAHKLQFLSDGEEHYYGRNRGHHNMLAVTGACLMIRKELFYTVGGFADSLAVAFNDVDLCYSLYEAGYYNVVLNDMALYHHESLSRGKDEEPAKQKRLLNERDRLYELHPGLYARDPFYHKYLTRDILDVHYCPASRYEGTLAIPWGKIERLRELPGSWREDACLRIGVENAMSAHQWQYGQRLPACQRKISGYYVQGYTFVINGDNACYEKKLLLYREDGNVIFTIPVYNQHRPDIAENLKEQLHVDLTGFAVKIREEDLPEGRYRIGIIARDRCSRQRLYDFSNWYLEVD